jgi:hypothetical protein
MALKLPTKKAFGTPSNQMVRISELDSATLQFTGRVKNNHTSRYGVLGGDAV